MKTLRYLCTAVVAVALFTVAAQAAELAGTWKWTSVSKTSGSSEVTAVLKVQDGIITGTVTGRQGPADISDGAIKDGAVSFSVVHAMQAVTVTFRYNGKLEGDTITGNLERPGKNPGSVLKTDWKATRSH